MTGRPAPVYGRRQGHRLSAFQQGLVDTLLPEISVPLKNFKPGALDPRTLFPKPVEDVWLEIGFGKGEHLAAQAKAHPGVGVIGCEPYRNGVAGLLVRIKGENLANVRIHPDDGRHVLAALAARSIGRVFLLHPDPWPKKRHAKRRFVSPENLDALSRVMKPGAELRISSDHPAMVAWTLARMEARADFRWTAESAKEWTTPPADWPDTRFAAKARGRREAPVYLVFKKA